MDLAYSGAFFASEERARSRVLDTTPLYSLHSLSMWCEVAIHLGRYVDFIGSSASTLRRLHLTYAGLDPDTDTPLFTARFPLLTHLTLVDFLSPFLPCAHLTPNLTHLTILQDLDVESQTAKSNLIKLFTKVVPTLLDNLPSLTHLSFDFNDSRISYSSAMLDPSASRILVDICRLRGIKLSTKALFDPWVDRDASWLFCNEDGRLSETGWAPYVEASAHALIGAADEVQRLVRLAVEENDPSLTRGLLDLLRPVAMGCRERRRSRGRRWWSLGRVGDVVRVAEEGGGSNRRAGAWLCFRLEGSQGQH